MPLSKLFGKQYIKYKIEKYIKNLFEQCLRQSYLGNGKYKRLHDTGFARMIQNKTSTGTGQVVIRNCFNVCIQIHHQFLQDLECLVWGNMLRLVQY